MPMLRPARESDVPGLIELARRSWCSAFEHSAPPDLVQQRLAGNFEREWYPRYWPDMTVAEDRGILLGLVQPMKDEINGLWVDPAVQGRGVGTALLAHGEQVIAGAGYDRAWLSCSGFNPRALQFYLARGYRETHRETTERAGGLCEVMIYLERRLR